MSNKSGNNETNENGLSDEQNVDAEQAQKNASNTESSSIVKSVLLHVGILAMLLFSFDFSSKPQQLAVAAQSQADIIDATFIDSNVIEERKRQQQQAQADARAKQERERKQRQQQKREREKQERERVQREKRKKQKALEDQQRKKQEQERVAEQNRLEAQRKREAEQKALEQKRLEEQRRIEQQRQQKLAEERAAQAAAQQQFVLSETDKYIGLIKQVIQRNLIFESGAVKKECRLNIRMSSSGLVFDVNILSGDPALCRAAQAAVLRPDSLPVSKDPGVYEKLRDFNLTVEL